MASLLSNNAVKLGQFYAVCIGVDGLENDDWIENTLFNRKPDRR